MLFQFVGGLVQCVGIAKSAGKLASTFQQRRRVVVERVAQIDEVFDFAFAKPCG